MANSSLPQQSAGQTEGDLMAGYMLSCRVENQPEWMEGMVERINSYIIAIGGDERYQFEAGGFCLIEDR